MPEGRDRDVPAAPDTSNQAGLAMTKFPRTHKTGAELSSDEKLERIAAKLDDVVEGLEDIKAEPACEQDERLDKIAKDVNRAAEAIERTVDPDLARARPSRQAAVGDGDVTSRAQRASDAPSRKSVSATSTLVRSASLTAGQVFAARTRVFHGYRCLAL